MLRRAGQQVFGAEHVVFNGFRRAYFHQRHMLVGSCMEHNGWMIGFKHFIQTLDIADGADQRDNVDICTVFIAQLHFQLVGAIFVNIENQQLARAVAHDLAAQLTADGAAAARDQNHLVMQVFRDLGAVQLHFIAGKKVRGVQFTQTCHHRLAVGIHRLRVRQHPHAAMGGVAQVDYFVQALAFQRGDGDDDLHNMVLAHQFRDIRNGAAHRHALHAQAFFCQVVIHDHDRVAKAGVFAFAQVDRPGTGVASADDQQRGCIPRGGVAFLFDAVILAQAGGGAHKAPQKAHARNGRRVEHRTQNQHRTADGAGAEDQIKQQDKTRCQAG